MNSLELSHSYELSNGYVSFRRVKLSLFDGYSQPTARTETLDQPQEIQKSRYVIYNMKMWERLDAPGPPAYQFRERRDQRTNHPSVLDQGGQNQGMNI